MSIPVPLVDTFKHTKVTVWVDVKSVLHVKTCIVSGVEKRKKIVAINVYFSIYKIDINDE